MADELVKRLRRYHDNRKSSTIFSEAADAIEELSKPRWVSVTERLPEKRKWVLCRCEASIIEVLRWENNEWYHDPMHVYYPSFVTHWMPLPEPPKEEA